VNGVNTYKKNQRDLNIWAGESHDTPQGNYLAINLNTDIKFQNFIIEAVNVKVDARPEKNPKIIRIRYGLKGIQKAMQDEFSDLTLEEITELVDSRMNVMMLAATLNSNFIGRDYWRDKEEYERMRKMGSFKGSSLIVLGAAHTLTNMIVGFQCHGCCLDGW
jgi:hypothetical protein